MMDHLRHLESSMTRVLMEATLKLSSLTDAGCFVLFETSEGRRFGGSAALLEEFVDGKLSSAGARLLTLKNAEMEEKEAEPSSSSGSSSSGKSQRRDETTTQSLKNLGITLQSDSFVSPPPSSVSVSLSSSSSLPSSMSRKRSAQTAFNTLIDSIALSASSSSSPKSAKLSVERVTDTLPFDGAPVCVKEEEVVALERVNDGSSSASSLSQDGGGGTSMMAMTTATTISNTLTDDDWDDDIEEIIYDLDVTPAGTEVKPFFEENGVTISSTSTSSPFYPSSSRAKLPGAGGGVDSGIRIKDVGQMALVRDCFPPPIIPISNSFSASSTVRPGDSFDATSPSIPRARVTADIVLSPHPISYQPPQMLIPRPQTDALITQHRPMVEALEANQTELSLQKLDILGQQNVEEMFTKGTTAYALLKSCLYTQGKILSQLCPFKDREIKNAEVKSFFNDNFESIVLICPPNLRECYFSENPFWLVDLLESASKRNSKVSLMAFVKDQARNGFKAEFKKKRGDPGF